MTKMDKSTSKLRVQFGIDFVTTMISSIKKVHDSSTEFSSASLGMQNVKPV